MMNDHQKSVLVDVDGSDSIQYLMKRIGEKIEERYDLYKNLRCLRAEMLIKKNGLHISPHAFV